MPNSPRSPPGGSVQVVVMPPPSFRLRRAGASHATTLLRSQFDTVEPLGDDEDGVSVDVAGTIDEVTAVAETAISERLRT